MAQAIGDTEELERFAYLLQQFNENASEQVPYLAAFASRMRDYLQS